MNKVEIPEVGFSTDVPASFDEMTQQDVLFVMKHMYRLQRGVISLAEFRVRTLYKLVGIKRKISSIIWERLHAEETNARIENTVILGEQLLDFMFTETNGQATPIYNSVINHLPVIRVGPIRLFGPADGLLDISFAELRAADGELKLYTQTGDTQHADNLITCLYRRRGPMQPSGRAIDPFSGESIDHYRKLVRHISAWKKQLIILWYVACVEYLQTGTFIIDGREICFAPLFAKEGDSSESLGWLSIHFDLAEKRTFGDMEQTGATSVIDILTRLYDYKLTSDHVRKNRPTD